MAPRYAFPVDSEAVRLSGCIDRFPEGDRSNCQQSCLTSTFEGELRNRTLACRKEVRSHASRTSANASAALSFATGHCAKPGTEPVSEPRQTAAISCPGTWNDPEATRVVERAINTGFAGGGVSRPLQMHIGVCGSGLALQKWFHTGNGRKKRGERQFAVIHAVA